MGELEKLKLLEETLEAEKGTLRAEKLLDEVEDYDSMSKLSLIVMFEDEFEKKLTGEDIKKLKTVKDILDLMEK